MIKKKKKQSKRKALYRKMSAKDGQQVPTPGDDLAGKQDARAVPRQRPEHH